MACGLLTDWPRLITVVVANFKKAEIKKSSEEKSQNIFTAPARQQDLKQKCILLVHPRDRNTALLHLKGLSHEIEMNYKWYKATEPY